MLAFVPSQVGGVLLPPPLPNFAGKVVTMFYFSYSVLNAKPMDTDLEIG
jgi:hypothetical protein